MSIAFQSFSWWTLFGSLSLALIYSWVLYKPEKKISMGWKWALATLRFSSSFLLALLLLSPVLNDINLSYEKPILFIVQDNSSSIIANGKANYYKSDFLTDRNESIEKLKEKFDLKNIRVGSALMYNAGIDYTDSKSHLSAIYQELESAYANRNVAAIVIATDGISNEGLEIESAASRVNIPSYFVMMGDSVRRIDLRIHELQHNDLVYANNDFLVQMKVKAFGLKGKDSKAIIRDAEKKVIWQEEIKIQSNDELISLSAALPAPTSKGLTKYSLQLLPAGTEQNINNNSADFYVELQDQKQKIGILFSNAHPDISALKQSLENLEGYELRLLPLEELRPEQYVDLQLAILHQVPNGNSASQRVVEALKAKQIPMLFILGSQSYLDLFNQQNIGLKIMAQGKNSNESTAAYAENFSAFMLSKESIETIMQFPPLVSAFGNYQKDENLDVMFYQRIGSTISKYPLVAFINQSGYRHGIIAGEGLWKWRMHNYREKKNFEAFDELVRKSIQFLATKEDRRKFKVQLSNSKLEKNEALTMEAFLYNDNYELVNTADVLLEIRGPKGKKFNFQFDRQSNKYVLNAGNFENGKYSFKANCKFGKREFESIGEFNVIERSIEQLNTVANFAAMRNASKISGGNAYADTEWDALTQQLLNESNFKTFAYEEKSTIEFIQFKWFALLIILVLSIEWFLRKYLGIL